jgi:hypothetical protein
MTIDTSDPHGIIRLSKQTQGNEMSNKLVTIPKEPTDEMIEALAGVVSEVFGIDDCYEGFVEAYKAMLRVGAKELPPREKTDDYPEGYQSTSIGFNHCLDEIEHRHFGLESKV